MDIRIRREEREEKEEGDRGDRQVEREGREEGREERGEREGRGYSRSQALKRIGGSTLCTLFAHAQSSLGNLHITPLH